MIRRLQTQPSQCSYFPVDKAPAELPVATFEPNCSTCWDPDERAPAKIEAVARVILAMVFYPGSTMICTPAGCGKAFR